MHPHLIAVAEDIAHLRGTWASGGISEATLRRESVILRRLLIDGDLARYWQESGRIGKPMIETTAFTKDLGGIPRDAIEHMQVGEARLPSGTYYGAFVLRRIEEGHGRSMEHVSLPVERYLETVIIYAGLAQVRRRHLIKYFANRLGGAHSETGRPRKGDGVFIAIDAVFRDLEIAERGSFHNAILSIGQDLIRTPEISSIASDLRPGSS